MLKKCQSLSLNMCSTHMKINFSSILIINTQQYCPFHHFMIHLEMIVCPYEYGCSRKIFAELGIGVDMAFANNPSTTGSNFTSESRSMLDIIDMKNIWPTRLNQK